VTHKLNLVALRIALLRRGLTQVDLAALVRLPPTTLSGYLLGRHPMPSDLTTRIEEALDLPSGVLALDDGDAS
jgi:hypothetical protein